MSRAPSHTKGDAPGERAAHRIREALQEGRCPSDRAFDRLLPDEALREVSSDQWTPIAVALRVAEWLKEVGARTLLDIGSGAGKLGVVVALVSEHRSLGIERALGLERDGRLVAAARALAARCGVEDRVDFIHGDIEETALPPVDAYYLFNPFSEHLRRAWRDGDTLAGKERYSSGVEAVERLLREAPTGTFVITYNGFGGDMPSLYREVRVDRGFPCVLRMWRKAPRRDRPG
ncbi:MAG: hypothetical protein R3B70_36480 [Polyangiaceae bacterium]